MSLSGQELRHWRPSGATPRRLAPDDAWRDNEAPRQKTGLEPCTAYRSSDRKYSMNNAELRLRALMLALALSVGATVSVLAQAAHPEPLSIARQGYLFAGGKYSTVNGRQVMSGQLYVEFQIPARQTHPWPIVMIHGGSQSGTNFTGTPDGREGWAQFFLRRGYPVYVVDQPGRGRAAYETDLYGPDSSSESRDHPKAIRRAGALQPLAAGASAHAMAGEGRPGRSCVRSVLRVANTLDAELHVAAVVEPGCHRVAAREDRPVDSADALTVRSIWLACRGCATGSGKGHRRGRAERAAFLQRGECPGARVVSGCSASGANLGRYRRAARVFTGCCDGIGAGHRATRQGPMARTSFDAGCNAPRRGCCRISRNCQS